MKTTPREPAETSQWAHDPLATGDGVVTYQLRTWRSFYTFLEREMHPARDVSRRFIWRGQRSDWSLSSTLDRLFDRTGILAAVDSPELEARAAAVLEDFKYAARGRRGTYAPMKDDNEWWALGQHYGLATPLLDWTRSPYAAAYFAFEEDQPALRRGKNRSAYRVIYALDRLAVGRRSESIMDDKSVEHGRSPVIEFVDPLYDGNPRLVSQGGLFTRAPLGTPVERWIMSAFEGAEHPVLYRIKIPDNQRLSILRSLARMNVTHLSLFPDLNGASRFVNMAIELENGDDSHG